MGLRQLEYKKIVAIAFVIGLFMDILDTTIINVAVPALQKHFAVGPSGIEWVVTGYLCSLAVWIPASGWIGDRFGTKKTFIFALAMFTAASALCGAAWSLESLIAFRVLQGVGGGMLAPVGTAMLFRAYPPAERARASAVLAIPTVIAPALGPVLGGVLVTHASWRWIFYVNLPMGVAGLIFSVLFLKEHKEPQSGGFDLWGFILSGAGLALVLFALAEGPSKGWTSTTVLATGITGLVAFIALVFVELRVAEPMLDLRLFQDRMFRQANIVTMTMTGSLLGLLFLLPMFLQNLRGLSAEQSGLATFPQAIGVMAMARFAGSLYPKIGPRRLMMAGSLANAAITACFVMVDLGTNLWWIRLLMFVRGMSMAFVMIPMQAATFATITPAKTGRASSLANTNRQVGAALGVAILATILTTRMSDLVPAAARLGKAAMVNAQVTAFHETMLVSAAIGVCGLIAAAFIHDSDAAATLAGGPSGASAAMH
jgi:EmrB/QacA subfamily drug resistance transporter